MTMITRILSRNIDYIKLTISTLINKIIKLNKRNYIRFLLPKTTTILRALASEMNCLLILLTFTRNHYKVLLIFTLLFKSQEIIWLNRMAKKLRLYAIVYNTKNVDLNYKQ